MKGCKEEGGGEDSIKVLSTRDLRKGCTTIIKSEVGAVLLTQGILFVAY